MKALIKYILRILANAGVLYLATQYLPGISVGGEFSVAVVAIFILSLYNAFVRPIIKILAIPINLLTFGIFSFVTNILVLYLIAFLVPGFDINNFVSAAFLSIILSFVNSLLNIFLK